MRNKFEINKILSIFFQKNMKVTKVKTAGLLTEVTNNSRPRPIGL